MKHSNWVLYVPLGLVVVALVMLITPSVFANHEADNVSYLSISGDSFANWDFEDDDSDSTTKCRRSAIMGHI